MKPETTWKEKWSKDTEDEIKYLVSYAQGEESKARLLSIFRNLLSSSQALARREGLEESIKAVEAFRKDWEISFNDDIRNRFIEKILEALQEKVDTKA